MIGVLYPTLIDRPNEVRVLVHTTIVGIVTPKTRAASSQWSKDRLSAHAYSMPRETEMALYIVGRKKIAALFNQICFNVSSVIRVFHPHPNGGFLRSSSKSLAIYRLLHSLLDG